MINVDELKSMVTSAQGPVLSLYLRVDPALQENQATIPAWQIWAKDALREMGAEVAKEERDAWNSVHERVSDYLATYNPQAKGLVLFYGENFEQQYELPVPLSEDAIRFGEPWIVPLLWLIDEYERYIVVLVDSEEAHFLKTYLGDIGRDSAMASDRFTFDFHELTRMSYTTGSGGQNMTYQGGSDRDKYDDMVDEMVAKFHKEVAQRTREMMQTDEAKRIVIGGTERAAHAVYNFLHQEVARAVIGILPIPFYESDEQVMQRMLPAALEYERKEELEMVQQVIDFAKSRGRGALGLDAVRDTLEQQRVELLILPWPGGVMDDQVMHDLTMKAMHNNSKVELVHGEAADLLQREGMVAARLYYAI